MRLIFSRVSRSILTQKAQETQMIASFAAFAFFYLRQSVQAVCYFAQLCD